MSDSSSRSSRPSDPISQGLRAWADVWRRAARELGRLGDPDDFASPSLRAMAERGEGSSEGGGAEAVAEALGESFEPLARYWLDTLGSGLRFYARAGESWTAYVARLAERLQELSEEDLGDDPSRLLIDEARGALREVQSFVSQEARVFGEETERLTKRLEELLDEAPLARSRPRVAKVKDDMPAPHDD